MLKDLMFKEMRLNWHPGQWLFLLLACLLLIPEWVYYIAFLYIFIMPMVVVQSDKANDDLVFTALLPVRKRDVVTARTWIIVGWELVYLAVAVVCAVVRMRFFPTENGASMNSNVAFFGTVFIMYAVFNGIFIAGAYKRPYRMLWPLLGGAVFAIVLGAVLDTLPLFVPSLKRLFNDDGFGHLPYQLAVLLVGIVAYAGATLWARQIAVARFERVDL
jgi:ABC-2 type transport system permease protein